MPEPPSREPPALPYDMGNAGDLLKHGWLAEFAAWWCDRHERPLRMLDPFGGLPWSSAVPAEVARRVRALEGWALARAQDEPERRYYGGGHVVRRVAEAAGPGAQVRSSDRDPHRARALEDSGLTRLEAPGFDPRDAYTVLEARPPADLLLLDPFDDFLPGPAREVLPRLAEAGRDLSVLLFALVPSAVTPAARQYERLRDRHLGAGWAARCPPLAGTGVRGESACAAEVVLLPRADLADEARRGLGPRLLGYARALQTVLGTRIRTYEPPRA